MYSSLDARSTVRASTDATCLRDLPADAPTRGRGAYITRGTSSLYTYRAVAGGRVGDHATSRPSARNERQTGALRRRADAAARESRIQFARALASQRPPSRERPTLGGGGTDRALFPSLCVSPFSRSIDDMEHGRRQVRGPPACCCWHITPGGGRRRRPRPYAKNHNCRRSRRLVDDPAPSARKGHGGVPGPRGGRRGPFGGAASLGKVRQARSQAATCCIDGPRRGPSPTPQETGFERHELNSCVGGAKS